MSYNRFGEKPLDGFYIFWDGTTDNLAVYIAEENGSLDLQLTLEQVKELKRICEEYINDRLGEKDG